VKPLHWTFVGRVGYRAAETLQERLRRRILDGDAAAERLLLVEHDPVITLGRAARRADVLAPEDELSVAGIELARSSRGGGVTYHGPGQLVAYPVVRLQRGVVAHVEAMAAAVVAVARAHGIDARFRRDCPGVWAGDAKLAAIGVHVHRRVAIHGVALNVATDLAAFARIVPCGMPGARTTSLALASGRPMTVAEVAPQLGDALARAFGRQAVAVRATEELLSPLGSVE
jgi:lipoate-protein ligase B